MPRTLREVTAEEHALLKRAQIASVLVAHLFGGLIDGLFAQTYRSQIAGWVLVDFARD